MKFVGGVLQVLTETAFMLLFGLMLIGTYILQTEGKFFTYLLFGLAIILFYNVFSNLKLKHALAANFVIFIILMFVIRTHSYKILLLRNFIWFIIIGAYTYYLPFLESKPLFRSSFVWDLFFWVFGFIGIWVSISLINMYVFKLFHPEDPRAAYMYARYAFKVGGVLGFGAGTGKIVSELLMKSVYSSQKG